jgi:predicted SAM-dependent methyltransferase
MKQLLKSIIKPVLKSLKEKKQKKTFEKLLALNGNDPIKIVVGSSGIYEKGWIPTEGHFLNLLKEEDWLKYFKEDSISLIFAEHVWEHLTLEQGKRAAEVCYKFIQKGGKLRVAIPDGFHSSEDYINRVKPGGFGHGSFDHKLLYNYHTFSDIFQQSGFTVELLEYFDDDKNFHAVDWKKEEGFVHRSIRYDRRNKDGKPNYTSLIIDAIKL